MATFQNSSTSNYSPHCSPTTPKLPKQLWFGLFPVRSPLLRESLLFSSSSGYLDVSVLRVCFPCGTIFNVAGCPIRKSTDQRLFAPPRSLSQLITSFIASESQGIHHAPLIAFKNYYSVTITFNLLSICQRTFSRLHVCNME
jgi:hypothetical protein